MLHESTSIVASSLLARGSKYEAHTLRLRLRDGTHDDRVVIRHPGACVIVPILDGGAGLVMIRNRRFILGEVLLEFPAGTREPGEAPEVCARRELAEETGYSCGELIALGSFYTAPGMTDERMWAFAARGLALAASSPEPDEDLGVETVALARVWSMVDSGELHDAKSIVALVLAMRRGLLPEGKR